MFATSNYCFPEHYMWQQTTGLFQTTALFVFKLLEITFIVVENLVKYFFLIDILGEDDVTCLQLSFKSMTK